jgi:heat shock protein HslJ
MVHRFLAFLCLLTIAALASACTSPDPEPPPAPAPRVFGQWELVELNGQALVFDGRAPSLALAPDGKVAGFAGLNRFNGQTDAQGLREGRIAIGPMAVTKMAGSAEEMAFERRYLGALEGAQRVELRDCKLELWTGTNCVARFAAPR